MVDGVTAHEIHRFMWLVNLEELIKINAEWADITYKFRIRTIDDQKLEAAKIRQKLLKAYGNFDKDTLIKIIPNFNS